ncbi:MAG: DNA repair protein RecN [Sphingobacteriales bacterium]|nr:DNA repair protein RecN [Sphingobacteriales bacterium]
MLLRLVIKNYALINELDIEFDEGFNVITGETGTGKSILLGALGLILGNRVDYSILFKRDQKCIIEGTFRLTSENKQFFDRNDIDFENETIIRREISPTGKSRAFINDTPVNLDILQEFAESQIDIHTQHQTLQINNPLFQLAVLDSVAGNIELRKHYTGLFNQYKSKQKDLERLRAEEIQASKEYDYLIYQLNEIKALKPDPENDLLLQEELNMLENADKIRNNIAFCLNKIEDSELGIMAGILEVRKNLSEISVFNTSFESLLKRLESNYLEMKDIHQELINLHQKTDSDPERLQLITQRIDSLNHLLNKHHLTDIIQLIGLEKELEEKVNGFESLAEKIERLSAEIKNIEKDLQSAALELSKSREKVIPALKEKLLDLLGKVGMQKASINISLQRKEIADFNESGPDQIQLLFSSNPGVPMQLISKAASGGELSRIMLCIKSIMAGSSLLSTLIFDEIDQGVSGETAFQVAGLIKEIAKKRQVICITHLPQIASAGQKHFLVEKNQESKFTLTTVKLLDYQGRVNEIAKMIGGNNPPDSAIESAKLLLKKN